jgi:hypothetical protein
MFPHTSDDCREPIGHPIVGARDRRTLFGGSIYLVGLCSARTADMAMDESLAAFAAYVSFNLFLRR